MSEPEVKRYMFHGIQCEVYTTEDSLRFYASFPWRFRLMTEDRVIYFSGMPNYCLTARSAMMRAKARARWIADGTYSQRYK